MTDYYVCTYCGNITTNPPENCPKNHPEYWGEYYGYIPYPLSKTARRLGRPFTEAEREALDYKRDPLVGMDGYLLGEDVPQHPSKARKQFGMKLSNFIYGPNND